MFSPGVLDPMKRQAVRRPVARKIHRRRDADPKEGIAKYGKTAFADPVNKKYPIDTPGRIKAAWAYIHQPSNARKYTSEEIRTIKSRVRRAAKVRGVALPDPDEFVALMARVRKARRR
jgi:hypothetical protein